MIPPGFRTDSDWHIGFSPDIIGSVSCHRGVSLGHEAPDRPMRVPIPRVGHQPKRQGAG